jgi:hypothetical protein
MMARPRDEHGRFIHRPGARPRRRGPGRVPVVTCIACGARLSRGWVARAARSPHRWGYWMRSVPGKRGQRKEGDILLATTPRDDVLRWLGADAEYQGALCVQAVAWLLHNGWSLRHLQDLVGHLQARGFVQRVVERVYDRSPEQNLGRARATGYRYGGELHAELPRASATSFTIEEDGP